jgi:hypothetical protein
MIGANDLLGVHSNTTPIQLAINGELFNRMTLRDLFALVELYKISQGLNAGYTASRAYEVADAMMAIREAK